MTLLRIATRRPPLRRLQREGVQEEMFETALILANDSYLLPLRLPLSSKSAKTLSSSIVVGENSGVRGRVEPSFSVSLRFVNQRAATILCIFARVICSSPTRAFLNGKKVVMAIWLNPFVRGTCRND